MKRLNDYMMTELIGANNNHVVPSTPQSWAEYSDPKSRWTARKGLFWGAAEGGPIETGEIPPGNQNTVGFRTYKSVFDLGPAAEKYTVKNEWLPLLPDPLYDPNEYSSGERVWRAQHRW